MVGEVPATVLAMVGVAMVGVATAGRAGTRCRNQNDKNIAKLPDKKGGSQPVAAGERAVLAEWAAASAAAVVLAGVATERVVAERALAAAARAAASGATGEAGVETAADLAAGLVLAVAAGLVLAVAAAAAAAGLVAPGLRRWT